MSILVDANVLLRRTQPDHEHHVPAVESVAQLLTAGEPVCFAPQNIAEFWNVATRPVANNGIGLVPAAVFTEIKKIERFLSVLAESPLAYEEWKRLILKYQITGVRTHDARLVAVMNVHRVRRILTFNEGDFADFDIEVINPKALVG